MLPPESNHVDAEAELAVVIGRPARISPEQALDVVAGYTCVDNEELRSGPPPSLGRVLRDGDVRTMPVIVLAAPHVAVVRDPNDRGPGKVGDEDGGWVAQGSPDNIDPDSGTTPDEYLAADILTHGGETLRRITNGMAGLRTTERDDSSTVYSGTVEAGLIARESAFKEGQSIRVLPFGYVADVEAADPAAPLDAAVTVAADGAVREIAVTWGRSGSAWTYTVAYSRLGETPAPVAPANARDLLKERLGAD